MFIHYKLLKMKKKQHKHKNKKIVSVALIYGDRLQYIYQVLTRNTRNKKKI